MNSELSEFCEKQANLAADHFTKMLRQEITLIVSRCPSLSFYLSVSLPVTFSLSLSVYLSLSLCLSLCSSYTISSFVNGVLLVVVRVY
mgnify:CR=1 FL=1